MCGQQALRLGGSLLLPSPDPTSGYLKIVRGSGTVRTGTSVDD
jgi:hypothetical protein